GGGGAGGVGARRPLARPRVHRRGARRAAARAGRGRLRPVGSARRPLSPLRHRRRRDRPGGDGPPGRLTRERLRRAVPGLRRHGIIRATMATLTESRKRELQRDLEAIRSEEHTSELQSRVDLVCRLLLEKKKNKNNT